MNMEILSGSPWHAGHGAGPAVADGVPRVWQDESLPVFPKEATTVLTRSAFPAEFWEFLEVGSASRGVRLAALLQLQDGPPGHPVNPFLSWSPDV